MTLDGLEVTLLDTPGHVDFSAEMERTLQVLDYAVLVISGADGVQGHTRTLWSLLKRYQVPVFLFVNKMDQPGADRPALMEELKERLDDACLDFGQEESALWEQAALCDEGVLEAYLEQGEVTRKQMTEMIARRQLFPCFFGSALKLEGVSELLGGLRTLTRVPDYSPEFAARVFKISRDELGARLTWMKITGGSLRVKMLLSKGEGENRWEEKADQIRVYSGLKFQTVDTAQAGTVCAVTGLSHTRTGDGLGAEQGAAALLEPVLSYQLLLPEGTDPHRALLKLGQLEEEDPQLHLVWNPRLGEIHLQLMGPVQMEILRRLIWERFGLAVEFGTGGIVYKETIASAVEGIGHYEPLRHYAEVHLLMEPGEPGSGVQVAARCPPDTLDLNWQRLVLTHLLERQHPGVLTGAPLTDVRLTLVAGRAHLKHTEGGDFRQATYRAVRQGLMQAEAILLEPWYDFQLEVPGENLGRAMADIQRMSGQLEPPETRGETSVLTGSAPVAAMGDYQLEVAAYTRGQGRLSCSPKGYFPCHNQAEVAAAVGYDPERDTENPADSIFCDNGGGLVVKWNQVKARAHVDSGLRLGEDSPPREEVRPVPAGARPGPGSLAEDKELLEIFERTYGKVTRRDFTPQKKPARTSLEESYVIREREPVKEYLLVDGYNIMFAWEELKAVAKEDVSAARQMLMDILSNYQGFRKCELILVFDAYKVKGNPGSVTRYHNIHVVYTREAETADNYIEKVTLEIGRDHRVRVATSDYLEQLIILGHGALRVSARTFKEEVELAQGQIARLIAENNRKNREGNRMQFPKEN